MLNEQKINDAVLALLGVFAFDQGRSWKGYDFDVMNQLHEQGFISDPKGHHKSVYLTALGQQRARELAEQMFAKSNER